MRYHVGTSWNAGTIVAGYDWFGNDFNDDVMWLIIAAIRGYQATGKRMYLDDAKRNFELIYNRAYLGYVGLLRWAYG
jgi:predicted alpha-1,6-mannanase (GH76 family)